MKLYKNYSLKIKDLPFGGISYEKKYINVLGPTGVGKTTTIAKMAATMQYWRKRKKSDLLQRIHIELLQSNN